MTNAMAGGSEVIQAGFSPRPTAEATTVAASSPSKDPETLSPNALLDGPVIQELAQAEQPGDMTFQNGVVSFGK